MQNFVVSGKPKILIRCGSDFEMNGVQYKKGQPVCFLQDSDVEFTYSKIDNTSTQGPRVVGYSGESELIGITIKNVPFNNMLHNLIFGGTDNNVWISKAFYAIPSNGRIAIPTSEPVKDVTVQDQNFNLVKFYFEENNILNGLENGNYIVTYSTPLKEATKLGTKPVRIPYFIIETIATGNDFNNKREPMVQYIKVNTAALQLEPLFVFNENISNFDLNFVVVKNKDDFISYGK